MRLSLVFGVGIVLCLAAGSRAAIMLNSIGGTGVDASVAVLLLNDSELQFSIQNTASEPGSSGTITNIGFDLPGDRPDNYSLVFASNASYRIAHDVNATAGAQNLTDIFDFILFNGNGNPTFGGGSVNDGIAPGTSATFRIAGDFTGVAAGQLISASARFQAVNGDDSDVAHGNVPEPASATVLMMMSLGGSTAADEDAGLLAVRSRDFHQFPDNRPAPEWHRNCLHARDRPRRSAKSAAWQRVRS